MIGHGKTIKAVGYKQETLEYLSVVFNQISLNFLDYLLEYLSVVFNQISLNLIELFLVSV